MKSLEKEVGGCHYKKFVIQPIEFCGRNKLDFMQGNIIKYICRFRDKNGLEDLEKIKHYVDVLIDLEYPEVSIDKTLESVPGIADALSNGISPEKVAEAMHELKPAAEHFGIVGNTEDDVTKKPHKPYLKMDDLFYDEGQSETSVETENNYNIEEDREANDLRITETTESSELTQDIYTKWKESIGD